MTPRPRETRPVMSVVITGHRNEETVVDAVRSVLDQAPDGSVEVVYVAAGPDRSGDRVRWAYPHVAVVTSPERMLPGRARNAGFAIARGGIVAFMDADCVAEPGSVAARIAAHHAGHAAVAGTEPTAGPPAELSSVRGVSFDRDLLEQIDGFDETLTDGELDVAADRARELGHDVWFAPEVRSTRVVVPAPHRTARQQVRRGLGRVRRTVRGARPSDRAAPAVVVTPAHPPRRVATEDTPKLLVVGTGRSGSTYCTQILRQSGVSCGHEDVYTPPVGLGESEVDWQGFAAEASWIAVPFLADLDADVRPVLVVRHPLAVVQSFLSRRFFAEPARTEFQRVVERCTPQTYAEATEPDRALAHWLTWNRMAAEHAEASRLEDIDAAQLREWLRIVGVTAELDQVAWPLAAVPRDTNAQRSAKHEVETADWSTFRPALMQEARAFARELGYDD